MKKIIVFCVAFLATMSLWASETSVENAYGVEIWYDFDNESNTASVTYKGFGSSEYSDEYTGEVVIPSTVTYKDEEYSVTTIGISAFYGCSSLTSITLPSSLTTIEWAAFAYCSSLTSITLPESVTSIDEDAFYGCSSLTSIDVASNNNNYTSIDGVLFSKDKTILIKYPEGKDATSYIIPESVTTIGYEAFYGCRSLTIVTIPESVTEIGKEAFRHCSSLTSITIPEGVTEIGDYAFNDCSSLTSITCKNTTPPKVGYYTFVNVDKSIPLYVPAESVEAYKNAEGWKDFTNIQAIPFSSVANAKVETQDSVRKEYRDGQVLIIKGDKTYTMFGKEN